MLPQDYQSPHRQQRFIAIENVGGYAIPPFGVCEVVDSYRPESGNAATPTGGITVLKVQRPTVDSPCAWVVNWNCTIPASGTTAEKTGIGTKDSPMNALVDSAAYSNGDVIGVEADSFALTEGKCGFVVDGDYDATYQCMRVTRRDNCPSEAFVRATVCHKLGESGAAQPQRFNSTLCEWEDDTNISPITVIDPECWRIALIDEKYWVHHPGGDDCGSTSPCDYMPKMPFGLTRRVKLTSTIECNDYDGEVPVLENTDESCGWTETSCLVKVCNTTNRTLACDADEYATATFIPGECVGFLTANPRPLHARATLSSASCGDSVSFDAADIDYIDVCDWTTREDVISATNPLGIYACDADKVDLKWNDSLCGWEVSNSPDHVVGGPVLDVYCEENACSLRVNRETSDRAVHLCVCAPTTSDEGLPTAVVTAPQSISFTQDTGTGDCQMNVYYQRFCVLGCSEPEAANTQVWPFIRQRVLNDAYFYQSGLCLYLDKSYVDVFVPCVANVGDSTDPVCGDDCIEEGELPVTTEGGDTIAEEDGTTEITTE